MFNALGGLNVSKYVAIVCAEVLIKHINTYCYR